jgi:hypothetical protein
MQAVFAKQGPPKPRPQPRARKERVPRQIRQTSTNCFNAMSRQLVPAPFFEGKAFPTFGLGRTNITLASGQQLLFMTTNGGCTATAGVWWDTSLTASAGNRVDVPSVATTPAAGGPTSGRSMKYGVEITNTTAPITREGRVYVLTANQRFNFPQSPIAMTSAQWLAFADSMKNHPNTRVHSASDFATPMLVSGYPSNDTDYYNYNTWFGAQSAGDFCRHMATWPAAASTHEQGTRPMTSTLVLLDVTSSAQSYNITFHQAWYTRFPLDHIVGQHMVDVPLASPQAANLSRLVAQEVVDHSGIM